MITSPLAYIFAHGGQLLSPLFPALEQDAILWNRLTSSCFLNLFPQFYSCLIHFYLTYFLCLLLFFFLLSVNGFLRSVSSTFCFLTLHILLIQPSVADDSNIYISSLVFPVQSNRYFQSLLKFLTLVPHSTSCNLAHYFSPFDFSSKSALSDSPCFPPLHSGCLISMSVYYSTHTLNI